MKFIIDGYNLIGHLGSISLKDKNKETLCIHYIQSLKSQNNHMFTLIFDGKNNSFPYKSIEYHNNINVIYTPYGESADDFIIDLVNKMSNKSGMIVVSSDKDIINKSIKSGAQSYKCSAFQTFFRSPKNNEIKKPDIVSNKEVEFWLEKFN